MADIKKRIAEVAEKDKSKWLEEARYRRENRDWLLKSKRIALLVLGVLKERGMQQKELAEQLGVSPQQISKIVKGKENLTLETISKLENALGVSLVELPNSQPSEIGEISKFRDYKDIYKSLFKDLTFDDNAFKKILSHYYYISADFKFSKEDIIGKKSFFDFKIRDSKKSVVDDIEKEEWREPDKSESNLRLVG